MTRSQNCSLPTHLPPKRLFNWKPPRSRLREKNRQVQDQLAPSRVNVPPKKGSYTGNKKSKREQENTGCIQYGFVRAERLLNPPLLQTFDLEKAAKVLVLIVAEIGLDRVTMAAILNPLSREQDQQVSTTGLTFE